jgi:hypothetical protein
LRTAILGFAGMGPLRQTLIGGAAEVSTARAAALLAEMRDLGRDAG